MRPNSVGKCMDLAQFLNLALFLFIKFYFYIYIFRVFCRNFNKVIRGKKKTVMIVFNFLLLVISVTRFSI